MTVPKARKDTNYLVRVNFAIGSPRHQGYCIVQNSTNTRETGSVESEEDRDENFVRQRVGDL